MKLATWYRKRKVLWKIFIPFFAITLLSSTLFTVYGFIQNVKAIENEIDNAAVFPPCDIAAAVSRLKAATELPVAVGFGVKTPQQAADIARHADAVVVGSAIVDLVGAASARQSNDIPGEVERFVSTLATAVRSARLESAA